MRDKLVIVQPYVPKYRHAFFESLRASLSDDGIDMEVLSGRASGEQMERQDSSAGSEFGPIVKGRNWKVGPVRFEHIGFGGNLPASDVLILPAAATSIDALSGVLRRPRRAAVGLWGHIRPYTNQANKLDLMLEGSLMRRADHVFAYTPGGACFAETQRVPSHRITTVMNSLDVSDLLHSSEGTRQVDEFRERHGLEGKTVYSFWGGLDSSKRISFLAAALDQLWRSDRGIHFLIGGRGRDELLLHPAAARGQVTLLGYADAATKSMMGEVSEALVVPGRIGLIAVEGLAMKLPILTTDWPFHAPEYEYLVNGESVFTSANDASSYAALLAHFPSESHRPQMNGVYPSLQAMVDNFAAGVRKMLTA